MVNSQIKTWLTELSPDEIALIEEIQYLTQEVTPMLVLELILINLDLLSSRIQALHPEIPCQSGCSRCCEEQEPMAYAIEADLIQEMFPNISHNVSNQKTALPTRGCLFLKEGRCQIYAARPVVCRAKGYAFYQAETKLPMFQKAAEPWTCEQEKQRICSELEQTHNPIKFMYMPLLNQYQKLVLRIDQTSNEPSIAKPISHYFNQA